jgi:hypothetical protein
MSPTKLHLPLHRRPVEHHTKNRQPVSVAQKAVLIDDQTLMLWAGSLTTARKVARELEFESLAGGRPPLQAVLAQVGLSSADLDNTWIALHRLDKAGDIHVEHHNFRRRVVQGAEALEAGSGTMHFIDGLRLPPTTEPEAPVLACWLERVGQRLWSEATERGTLDHGYGGWFELVIRDGGRFVKLPYAFQGWNFRPGKLVAATGVFSWYVGNRLYISQVVDRELLRATENPEATAGDFSLQVISDLLDRDITPAADASTWSPSPPQAIQFHVVMDHQRNLVRMCVDRWPRDFRLSLVVEGSRLEAVRSGKASFFPRIHRMMAGLDGGRLLEPIL